MNAATTNRTMILERRTSVLTFVKVPDEPTPPDGEYTLRGGICWPIVVDMATNQMAGFAVMVGCHMPTRQAWVLAQTPFVTIDHVQDAKGAIQFHGLSTWFVDAWGKWFADTYGWKQPWETNRRYLKQVLTSPMIQPKPHLLELEWDDDADARAIVFEAEATGRLKYERDSPLHRELLEFTVAEPADRSRFPAVHSLTCALFSLESAVPPRRDRPWQP